MQIVPKITVKTIGAQPKPHSVEEGHPIANIYGLLRKYSVGQSTYGDFLKFQGSVEAKNIETGEVFKSGSLILPNVIAPILQDAIDANPDADVEFAVIVGVEKSEKGNTGYSYTIEPLFEVKETEAMSALRLKCEKATKALEAPEPKKKSK